MSIAAVEWFLDFIFEREEIRLRREHREPLHSAPDWWTFVVSGPGSKKSLNYVLGRPAKASWRETDWRRELRKLHEAIAPELKRIGVGRLHAQDLQSCLCEYSKYEGLRLGETKSGRLFSPRRDPNDKRGLLF